MLPSGVSRIGEDNVWIWTDRDAHNRRFGCLDYSKGMMNLDPKQKNSVGCDRISTGEEARRAVEFLFQTAFELGCISGRTSAVGCRSMDMVLDNLAWAAFCNDTLNRKNN
jgi:hypothetical protein